MTLLNSHAYPRRVRGRAPLLALAIGFASLAGLTAAADTPADPPAKKPEAKVELKEVTVKEFEADVKKRFAGKVVAVDVWFLGCAPCVEKFPDVVALAGKLADSGAVFVTLDMMPDEAQDKDKVLAFLKKHKATTANYIFKDTEENVDAWQTRSGFRPTPAVLLFDKKGERVKTLLKPTKEKLEEEVRALLGKK